MGGTSLLTSGVGTATSAPAPAKPAGMIHYDPRIEEDTSVGSFDYAVYIHLVYQGERGEPVNVRAISHEVQLDDSEVRACMSRLREKGYLPAELRP